MPVVRLALDAESIVVGYWSDGTADVEIISTLRNEGTLPLDDAQKVTATCVPDGDDQRVCRQEMTLSLPDGYGPSSTSFTVRLPMGVTTVKFDYGGDESLTLNVEVPERILGVDRDLWECYSDRPQERTEIEGEFFYGCGGWGTPTVEKWLNDVPVKVWATGDPDYIASLETILMELAPILGLEFVWVDSEEEADFKAYVGVPRSEGLDLGFAKWVDYGGIGSAGVHGGEATSGYIVVWYIDDTRYDLSRLIKSIVVHEALHALVPIGHSLRPASIMGGSGLNTLSPRDAQLVALNSHNLVRPGMTMSEVRELIVISDDLLDYDPGVVWNDPMDLVWRAYVALEEAGSASFRLSGGWTDKACNLIFGVRRGPIELSIGDFKLFRDNPALSYLNIHTSQFYIIYSRTDQEWTHWKLSPQGTWQRVDYETVADASSWWVWNGKLHAAIRSVLKDGSPEDMRVDETADGNLVLSVTLDHTYVNMWDWTKGDSLDLTLVLDPETFAIEAYTWELHKNPGANPGSCLTYKEVATDGRLGVDIKVPEEIRSQLAMSPG